MTLPEPPDHPQQPQLGQERYSWIRCAACGNGLWKIFSDRLEMPITLRGRQKRVVVVDRSAAHLLTVKCEKCDSFWTDVVS